MIKDKYVNKSCNKHGLVEFVLEGRGYYRCKKCRVESVTKRRRKLKSQAIEYKGGKCVKCGYSKCNSALVFHHTDDNKEFAISQEGVTRSWDKVKEEINKCVLLCANCHAETHENISMVGVVG